MRPRPASAAAIGDEKIFLILNDVTDQYLFTTFTLRGVGDHIEIWVQNNLNFPTGDCRNDGVRNVVTTGQVNTFIHEFDTNIYPKESAAFSVPPDRDGSGAQLPGLLGQPNALGITPDYYEGDGEKIVTLVSNVRDTNYFTPPNVSPSSYIAGFFSSQLNGYFDRNVMTIDSYDWVHRTGANPPDNPVPGDLCASAPARPFLYEGVFAHEYQHLLESYEDGDEVNWINEGLSDWAQTLVGYVKPATPITQRGFDSHVQCFTGFLEVATPVNVNPSTNGGPENSLTRWQDQGPNEILADYGAAYTMMELLAGRYGTGFMSSLHRGEANGFAGVDEALAATGQQKANALVDLRRLDARRRARRAHRRRLQDARERAGEELHGPDAPLDHLLGHAQRVLQPGSPVERVRLRPAPERLDDAHGRADRLDRVQGGTSPGAGSARVVDRREPAGSGRRCSALLGHGEQPRRGGGDADHRAERVRRA